MAWTDKYLVLGGSAGDGSISTPWGTFAEALAEIGAITAPTRVYVQGNETLGANINWNVSGANATPLTFVGCDSSWNVIGNNASATKPTLTCGAYLFDITGSYITLDNIAFTSSHTTAGGTMDVGAAYVTFKRCRFTATGANANSVAMRIGTASGTSLFGCYLNATTTATAALNITDANGCIIYGGVIEGGVSGIVSSSGSGCFAHNIIHSMGTGSGIVLSYSGNIAGSVINNTIIGHATADDGITLSGAIPRYNVINNLIVGFSQAGSYPIYFSNATAPSAGIAAFNAWHNCANNSIGGAVETQASHAGESLDFANNVWNYGLLAADPLPNAATLGDAADFTLASSAKALAFPGIFEAGAYAYQGYLDHGAIQRPEDYPAVEDVESGVTYGGLGATAGSKALTGTLAAGGGGGAPVFGGNMVRRV